MKTSLQEYSGIQARNDPKDMSRLELGGMARADGLVRALRQRPQATLEPRVPCSHVMRSLRQVEQCGAPFKSSGATSDSGASLPPAVRRKGSEGSVMRCCLNGD